MKLFILGERTPTKTTIGGWIKAGELIEQFDNRWFPAYQRDRVNSTKKINELKAIIAKDGSLPAVVINLVGDTRKVTDGYNFNGELHVIDGQQRILAMVEAGNSDYLLFVQAHVNLAYEDEVTEFQNLNAKATKLPYGYLVKSTVGPAADVVRKFAEKGALALPVSVTDRKTGIPMGWIAPLLHNVYKKLIEKKVLLKFSDSKNTSLFLGNPQFKGASVTEFGVRNLAAEYVKMFGKHDPRALAYTRIMFFSINLVMIHNFLTQEGKIDWRGFKNKVARAGDDFSNSSYVKELINGSANSDMLYDEFIKYLNHGVRAENKLPRMRDLREAAKTYKKYKDTPLKVSLDFEGTIENNL